MSTITSVDRHLKGKGVIEPSATVKEAKQAWAETRSSVGVDPTAPPLLTLGQAKFAKGEGEVIAGITLAPANEVGLSGLSKLETANLCDFSTPQCEVLCLRGTGRLPMSHAVKARIARTVFLINHPTEFLTLIHAELQNLSKKHDVALRPDVLSDLSWDQFAPWLADDVSIVYGYTKNRRKAVRWNATPGWYATFSASERTNLDKIKTLVENGINVAVAVDVGKNDGLPQKWGGMPVIDGDANDRRYLDKPGHVVLLRAKSGRGEGSNRKAMSEAKVSVSSFIKPGDVKGDTADAVLPRLTGGVTMTARHLAWLTSDELSSMAYIRYKNKGNRKIY